MTYRTFKQPNGLWRAQPKDVMAEPYVCGHGSTPQDALADAQQKLAIREPSA